MMKLTNVIGFCTLFALLLGGASAMVGHAWQGPEGGLFHIDHTIQRIVSAPLAVALFAGYLLTWRKIQRRISLRTKVFSDE